MTERLAAEAARLLAGTGLTAHELTATLDRPEAVTDSLDASRAAALLDGWTAKDHA